MVTIIDADSDKLVTVSPLLAVTSSVPLGLSPVATTEFTTLPVLKAASYDIEPSESNRLPTSNVTSSQGVSSVAE